MALINFAVYCRSSKRALLPWKIASVSPPNSTFRAHYGGDVTSSMERDADLVSTFVGKSKDHTDEVDSDLTMAEVCGTFGQFVKYFVEEKKVDVGGSSSEGS